MLLRLLDLHWLEEPVCPPDDHCSPAAFRRVAGIPVATGKDVGALHGFADLFASDAVDVPQPSVARTGVTEFRWVLTLARAHGVRVVPHCACFRPGCLASLHLEQRLMKSTSRPVMPAGLSRL